ncbi:MAG: zf-HC2 domain-containing protein, partial [Anaerolineales bacterium]|nr:zf-HC2 domain-containing protein [Anaerolineales bacterium]
MNWQMGKHLTPQQGLAYLEGQLDAAQRAKVERHLADCAACRETIRQHQAVHHMLHAAGQEE